MGRPRRPVESRIADGSYYRKSRHGPISEPDESVSVPERPGDLVGDARKFWDELVRLLGGVVRERDGWMLAELCRCRAEVKRVRAELKKKRPGAADYNRTLIAYGIAFDKMDKIACRFGFTPSDRAKINAEITTPQKPRVPTRPRTKLDLNGRPK